MPSPVALVLLASLVVPLAALSQGVEQSPSSPAPTPVLTRPPELLHFVEAVYPPDAEAARLSGTVTLEVDLSESGTVTNARVVAGAGHGFDEAALAAVRQFTFRPAEVDGKPAPVRITYAYQFVLREVPPEGPLSETVKVDGPVNYSGQVLERGTRRKLAGAEVALPELGLTATADNDGRFELRSVPEGEHRVVVVVAEHDRFETKERITPGKQTQATYFVRPALGDAYQSVVRGEREKKEVSQTSVKMEEVQRIPGTQGDTLKVVQNFPGVARSPFNGGLLVIRGSSPNDSGIFLDGQPLPLLFHFGGLTSVYSSELLESVEYFPGNYSSYYGNVSGGVVDVRSRAPKSDGLHGNVSLSLLESSLLLEGPLTDTLSFAVAARRSYVDVLLGAAMGGGDEGPDLSVAPRYYDAQARLEWKPNPRHTFVLLGLISNDKLGLLFDRPSDADPTFSGGFNLETGFLQLRPRHVYKNGPFRLDTSGLVDTVKLLVDVGSGPSGRYFELTTLGLSLRSTGEYEFSKRLTLAVGVDVQQGRADVRARVQAPPREGEPQRPGAVTPVLEANGRFFQYTPGYWAELRYRPVDRLLLVPGLRAESYVFSGQKANKRHVNPRLGARFELTPRWTLKGGAGVYRSPPSQDEPSVDFGNPDLRAERSFQYSVGAEWKATDALFVGSEVFYNQLDRLIVSSNRYIERDGEWVPERLGNGGEGRVYGAEFMVRYPLTRRFFGWLAYTLSRSERRRVGESAYRLFDYDQTHVLTAIGSYKLPRGWQVGARFRLVSGNPVTPVDSAVRDDGYDLFIPQFGALNSERLPLFHQLDVRVDKTWLFERWSLELFLDLQNAYNRPAVEGVSYSYDYRERDYFTGLPLLPSLGVKGAF